MPEVFVSPDGPEPRWAWTEGLERAGRDEIAAPLFWPAGDPRDSRVADLLAYVAEYAGGTAGSIQAGETMSYGWTNLRFRPSEAADAIGPGFLVVAELADPLALAPTDFADGAERAVDLLARQVDALRRNLVPGEAEPPHRMDAIFTCSRVPPGSFLWNYPLCAARLERESEESGWFLGCYERGHDHEDPRERERATLSEVVSFFPRLFPYLALPEGCAVIFTATETIIFRPGDEDGYLDPMPER